MKKNYFVLAVIAVMMMFVGCDTEHHDSVDSSSGTTVVALVWKGSLDAAPDNPQTNWAYYNTTDKKSYLYDGKQWQILAQDGEKGDKGDAGKDATADVWTIGDDDYWYLNGTKTEYKSKGEDGNNTNIWTIGDDGYWYLNDVKTEYLSKGTDGKDATSDVWTIGNDGYWYLNGEKTTHKSKGEDGHDGTNGTDGISIVWKGSLSAAPNDPTTDWA
ncbi:MAG: hypothetical protein J6Y01_07140, partial [Spirochaetales bacterium]|nr:hypothetical protein [Spirochaetales bacterium]